jgi:hypothetical protein
LALFLEADNVEFLMKRTIGIFVSVVLLALFAIDGRFLSRAAAAAGDPYEYFNALVKRSDHWKSYSLRSAAQMNAYRHSTARPMYVTYDPENDPYPGRQDAAKVSVPEFDPTVFSQLAKPISATDTKIMMTAPSTLMTARLAGRRSIRVESEIMTIVREPGNSITDQTVSVLRGQQGTSAKSHTDGSSVFVSSNILINQLRLPVSTEHGNSYLFTWDTWYGPEFDYDNAGIGNYKTFQFGAPIYFFQVDSLFSEAPGSNLAMAGARGTGHGSLDEKEKYGPNIISAYPLRPQVGQFTIHPETWTRYWVYIEQNAADWDPITMWVADESHDAVKLFDKLQFNVPDTILQFILEFSTSSNELEAGRGTMVAYVRNWVALRNPKDPQSLLQRPLAGPLLPPPSGKISPPKNLRIITSR